jgi:hypothetical protein
VGLPNVRRTLAADVGGSIPELAGESVMSVEQYIICEGIVVAQVMDYRFLRSLSR